MVLQRRQGHHDENRKRDTQDFYLSFGIRLHNNCPVLLKSGRSGIDENRVLIGSSVPKADIQIQGIVDNFCRDIGNVGVDRNLGEVMPDTVLMYFKSYLCLCPELGNVCMVQFFIAILPMFRQRLDQIEGGQNVISYRYKIAFYSGWNNFLHSIFYRHKA